MTSMEVINKFASATSLSFLGFKKKFPSQRNFIKILFNHSFSIMTSNQLLVILLVQFFNQESYAGKAISAANAADAAGTVYETTRVVASAIVGHGLCCKSVGDPGGFFSEIGESQTCEDGTLGTPCCATGKCNVGCCNCDGECRKPFGSINAVLFVERQNGHATWGKHGQLIINMESSECLNLNNEENNYFHEEASAIELKHGTTFFFNHKFLLKPIIVNTGNIKYFNY